MRNIAKLILTILSIIFNLAVMIYAAKFTLTFIIIASINLACIWFWVTTLPYTWDKAELELETIKRNRKHKK